MSSWNSGYVTDLAYTHGFYRELTPRLIELAALLKAQLAPSSDRPLRYCELACGQGFTTNLLAAANPHIDFYATDFNPSHIVGAQALAEEAGLPNVKFYDQSFEEFLVEPSLPEQFDIITLHGIYSWVTLEVRQQIIEFLRLKLRPGGIVYVSYNCLPGWSIAAPLRHLMYLHGKATGGPTIGRLEPAMKFIEEVMGKNALYFAANPSLKQRFEKMETLPRSYIAHEYMNDNWHLLYHSDVVGELKGSKLEFVGSAFILDHVDAINLTPDQITIMNSLPDRTLGETVRDYMVNQQFRRDLFVRGAMPLPSNVVDTAWRSMRVVLSARRADVPLKVTGARGEASLQTEVYEPLLDALAGGPKTVAELLSIPTVAPIGEGRIRQAIAILIGAGHAQPCAPPEIVERARNSVHAFNTAILRRARTSADLVNLASPLTGGGLNLDRFGQLFLLAIIEGADPVQSTWGQLAALNQRLVKEGRVLESETENLQELAARFETFQTRHQPVLEALDAIPRA